MTLIGSANTANVKELSHQILVDYIRERARLFDLKEKFRVTRQRIGYIVSMMTSHKLLEKARINFLREAWRFVMDIMCEQLSKDKKHKKKVDKLKLLPDSYRDDFLKAYFKRAKLRFRLKVLE